MTDERIESIRYRRGCARRRGSLFAPLVIIGLGVVFLLDQYNVFPADRAFSYFWPLVFIAFGVDALAWRHGHRRAVWGVIAIAIGVALILQNVGYWAFDLSKLWPLILIAVGLSLLFRRASPGRGGFMASPPWSPQDSAEGRLDGTAVLGGINRRITAQNFSGGDITAIFGGFQIDLTGASIAGETAVLDVTAFFGGGEIRVPTGWIIDIQGHALLGAYTDETHQSPPAPGAKRLVIQGTAVFGGVVIKS